MSQNVNTDVKVRAGSLMEDPSRLRLAYEKALTQNTELAVSLQKARAQIKALRTDGIAPEGHGQDLQSLKAERDKLQEELQLRFEEIAALTRMLEKGRLQMGQAGHTPHMSAILNELTGYTHALEQSHQRVLGSTSWRLTAPLRGLIGLLRGKKALPDFQYQLSDIITRHQLPPLQ